MSGWPSTEGLDPLYIVSRKGENGKEDKLMSDFELLSIYIGILQIIVVLLVALIQDTKK